MTLTYDVEYLEAISFDSFFIFVSVSSKCHGFLLQSEMVVRFVLLITIINVCTFFSLDGRIFCNLVHGITEIRVGCPHKDDVRFVFTCSCLQGASWIIYIICICLRIVVSNTYCVVFQFCLSSSCVPYVASFSGLSNLDCSFDNLRYR